MTEGGVGVGTNLGSPQTFSRAGFLRDQSLRSVLALGKLSRVWGYGALALFNTS